MLNALIPLLKKPLRFTKLLNKVRKHQTVNLKSKILKKISALLVKLKVCEPYLSTKATEMIQVNFTNLDSQPIIKLEINNINLSSTLDTGSSFTIIPDKHFQQLKIPISKLITEKNYSFQSASQMVTNAVQGTISLSVIIKNFVDSYQFMIKRF